MAKGKYHAVAVCGRCGKEITSDKVAATKYCPDCSAIVRREKVRENVARYRARKKADRVQ